MIQVLRTLSLNTKNTDKIGSPSISERNSVNPFRDIYEQHVDEASFLWLLRSIAVSQPHYGVEDLYELEQRIEANLDGLMTAPEEAWEICLDALNIGEAGEIFTAAVVAFRSFEMNKIKTVVEAGLEDEQCSAGLVSALGWLPAKVVHPWIKKFLTSKDLNHKYLAIAACSVRRENPGEYLDKMLQRDDCRQHKRLYTRALRLIGELKRQDLMPALEGAMNFGEPEVAFWASWSSLLLGDKSALIRIKPIVFNNSCFQEKAINLAFRALSIEDARKWISNLSNNHEAIRNVIKATGILGDPQAIGWLISQMSLPNVARLAGEAFTLITGIDLEENDLAISIPDLTEKIPNDDENDNNIDLDEDENLPWPNAEKIAATWQRYSNRFQAGHRYFMGQKITTENCQKVLKDGMQRQRSAAALEFAMIDHANPFLNANSRQNNGM